MSREDVRKFWWEHKLARVKFDKKRDWKEDTRKLCLDEQFLKSGKVV